MVPGVLVGTLGVAIVINLWFATTGAVIVTKDLPQDDLHEPIYRAPTGTAVLYGRNVEVSKAGGPRSISFELVQWVSNDGDAEQAALEEGECTLEDVEQDSCLYSGFYIRKTGKQMVLPVIEEPTIRVLARYECSLHPDIQERAYQRRVSLAILDGLMHGDEYMPEIPFIFTTSDGAIIAIEEHYVP